MAEEDNASPEDRNIEPSAKRKAEFRSEGRVPLSKDVISAGHLIALTLAFSTFGIAFYDSFKENIVETIFRLGNAEMPLWSTFSDNMLHSLGPLLAIGLIGLFGILAAGFTQTRFLFAFKLISFKLSRLNPVKKLQELFGPVKAGVRVGLALAKVALTGLGLLLVLDGARDAIPHLATTSIEHADAFARELMWQMLLVTVGAIVFIGVIDYAWQRRQIMSKLRMTREEAKREQEESEGKPQFKARRRQMHRELTANRIVEAVPQADVVITNPTHLAVAIKYRAGEDAAPIVTAKGADELAAIIRDIARKHAVPLVENKPVARELWRRVKVGQSIPQSLFVKVAEILARIYKARQA